MPTRILARAAMITALTFLVWLGFAITFPYDRLDVAETVFVWVIIAMVVLVYRSVGRVVSRYRARSNRIRRPNK